MAETSSSRRRVRAGLLAGALVVAVVGGGGWAVVRGGLLGRPAAATPTAEVPTGTATVARTEVVERQQVAGTLGYGDSVTVPGQAAGGSGSAGGGGSAGAGGGGQTQDGIVTRTPAVGSVLARGQALFEVDGHPVPLWYGSRPAWRAFQLGMADGPDVRQLEANLVALGFDPGRAITVDGHYSGATAVAVKRWQRATGRARTGAVALGQVVFLPGPIRVATVTATAGAPVPAGTAILTASPTRPLVTVALDAAMQQLVRRGDRVEVVLPDGKTTQGTVATVSRVATQPSTGSGQSGGQSEGQSGNGSGSGSGQATVQVTIRLAAPRAAANLDQAPVQVAITTQAHKGVLAVPINALLAQPGGGYAVRVLDGGSRRLVAVRTGLFDETAGLVEVQGAGLAQGATVEVPAP
jgi:peptidoglycan hydrolase-like protein with peptidoglycan-binding domain